MLRKTALLLLFALLHPPDISAQDLTRRSKIMVGLGEVIIADAPLPERVFQAQKHTLIVQVTLVDKKDPSFSQTSVGTGTILDSGVVLTNRHVLDGTKALMGPREYVAAFSGIIWGER